MRAWPSNPWRSWLINPDGGKKASVLLPAVIEIRLTSRGYYQFVPPRLGRALIGAAVLPKLGTDVRSGVAKARSVSAP